LHLELRGEKLRLGIDLHVLQGINQGSKTYLDNIYSSLPMRTSGIDLVFIFNRDKLVPKKWEALGEVQYFDTSGNFARIAYDAARQQKKRGLDAFHSQYICPLFSSSKDIVTIHDVLFETHPQYFSAAFNMRSKLLVRRSAQRAAQILTVSKYSKDRICEIYGIDESRVTVTSNGVNMDLFASIDVRQAAQDIKSKLGLSDYILTVGRLEPRKNHINLLKAYALLKHDQPDLPPLVIVGQRDFGFEKIFEFIEKNRLTNCVKIIEDADFDTLRKLYKCARLFVYPSFAEGFGIPPLEAMAAGCPVICSNTTSMKEVFSEGAIMIDPLDVDELVEALRTSIYDSSSAGEMKERSLAIAERYSWDRSSGALLNAINRIS
jgi:glycosyltransferase involved in cell wall biosynthesis